jgi:hypothetical protein
MSAFLKRCVGGALVLSAIVSLALPRHSGIALRSIQATGGRILNSTYYVVAGALFAYVCGVIPGVCDERRRHR